MLQFFKSFFSVPLDLFHLLQSVTFLENFLKISSICSYVPKPIMRLFYIHVIFCERYKCLDFFLVVTSTFHQHWLGSFKVFLSILFYMKTLLVRFLYLFNVQIYIPICCTVFHLSVPFNFLLCIVNSSVTFYSVQILHHPKFALYNIRVWQSFSAYCACIPLKCIAF